MNFDQKNIKESILITGSTGYLGKSILKKFTKKYNLIGVSKSLSKKSIFNYRCDLSDEQSVKEFSKKINPKVIIHAAGIKDIELCENLPEVAYRSNVKTIENICKFFSNSRVIYLSTDYVFDGDEGNYKEIDSPNPSTKYGETKYLGEKVGKDLHKDKFVIVRTASVFSKNSSFINFLLSCLKEKIKVEAYTDCIFSPTYIDDLVKSLQMIIEKKNLSNILHIAGKPISRFEFAETFFEEGNFDLNYLMQTKNNGKNKFLFKNLSLNTELTEKLLQTKPTPIDLAIRDLIIDIEKDWKKSKDVS